jgi:uncharacterized protein (DUF2062 family)/protein-L-isoaspartate O-methyltransferase
VTLTSSLPPASAGAAAHRSGWRRLFHEMRTEGAGREAASVGTGVFIGCLPIYGFHLLIVLVLGRLARLNRLLMYAAANISNPVAAPVLILAEIQMGAWMRRADMHALTLDAVRNTSPWTFGGDLVVGSLVLGAGLGILSALLTHAATAGSRGADPRFVRLANRVADRYLPRSVTAWEFARGKLLSDPVYEYVANRGVLAPGQTLLDLGCGQGLMLGLLAEIRRSASESPAPVPPVFERLIGIELRRRIAALARGALGSEVEILEGDVGEIALPGAQAVLAFDVLHMLSEGEQASLVARLAEALDPGGIMLVREVDAGGGWRFRVVHVGNRLKALVTGNWRQRFAFRTRDGWSRLLTDAGFHVSMVPMNERTPFANVLFVAQRRSDAVAQRRSRT